MVAKERIDLMVAIAERAEDKDLIASDRISLIMDLECADEEFHLRLEEFLNTDPFNFSHDIVGIQRHLNRETRQMENCFVPRFADTGN